MQSLPQTLAGASITKSLSVGKNSCIKAYVLTQTDNPYFSEANLNCSILKKFSSVVEGKKKG
jgi:hypothetical protein